MSKEYEIEKRYRDVGMFTTPDGTTEIQKLQVGRELLGISAFR